MIGRMFGGAWRAAGQGEAGANGRAVAGANGRLRPITTLTSLVNLPDSILRVPVFPAGKQALARLGVPAHTLLSGAAAFRDGVARLNRLLGPDPGHLAGQGLTRDEILGAALGILQAAHRTKVPIDTPEVLSLQYHLLSDLPADPRLIDAFDQHARNIVNEVSVDWMPKAQSSSWCQRAPSERESLLRQLADRMPVLPSPARLVAGTDSRFQLCFEPTHLLAAGMTPREDLDVGIVDLSAELLTGTPSPLADLALQTVPALLAHEMFHVEQYNALHLLWSGAHHTPQDLAVAVRYGLSIGTQEGLWKQEPSTFLSSFLPHEKETWALASLVLRATIRHPAVSPEIAGRLTERLVDTYPRYAHLMGDRFAPWARSADGVLRPGSESDLQTRDMPQADIRQRVEVFIEESLQPSR